MKVSTNAATVLRLIREHPEGSYALEEMAHELRLSKTATSRAIWELEQAGALTIEEET